MQNKLKILYMMAGTPEIFGGGKRVFLQIMTQINKNQFQFYSCCAFNKQQEALLVERGGTIIHIDIQNGGLWGPLQKLIELLRKEKINIVHSQGPRANFYSRIAVRLSGRYVKIVNTVPQLVEAYDVGFFRKTLYCSLDRFSERYVDRFLTVSGAVSDNLIHSHRIPADKVITIYNGIDVDYYSPDRKELAASGQEIRNEYKLTEDTVLIGGIGRLVGGKGFEYLINSIPEITNTYPDVRIIIVGEGPLRTSLEELGKRLEVSRNLIFVGFRKDIREILSAIDILVMPSLAEGFPMITLEAMAMAKPTVATEIEGTTEQIVNGKTGVLVPPGDSKALSGAIIDLLKNRTHAEEMGRLARGYAIEYFPVEKMVHSTVKVYWELIGETQSSHNN